MQVSQGCSTYAEAKVLNTSASPPLVVDNPSHLSLLVSEFVGGTGVSQSVDLGQSNNPNTTPTKDYEIVRLVVYLHSVQRGCPEEGERGSTPTG